MFPFPFHRQNAFNKYACPPPYYPGSPPMLPEYSQYWRDHALQKPNALIAANMNHSRELYENLGYDGTKWPFAALPSAYDSSRRRGYTYTETPHWDRTSSSKAAAWSSTHPCYHGTGTVQSPAGSFTPRFNAKTNLYEYYYPCTGATYANTYPSHFVSGDVDDPDGHRHWGVNWPTRQLTPVPPPKHTGPDYHHSRRCGCGCEGFYEERFTPHVCRQP